MLFAAQAQAQISDGMPNQAQTDRVETAGKFLRMVQRSDGDYEATITQALSSFADLMER